MNVDIELINVLLQGGVVFSLGSIVNMLKRIKEEKKSEEESIEFLTKELGKSECTRANLLRKDYVVPVNVQRKVTEEM